MESDSDTELYFDFGLRENLFPTEDKIYDCYGISIRKDRWSNDGNTDNDDTLTEYKYFWFIIVHEHVFGNNIDNICYDYNYMRNRNRDINVELLYKI